MYIAHVSLNILKSYSLSGPKVSSGAHQCPMSKKQAKQRETMVYKAINGLAPLYISNLVTIKSECSFNYNLRSSNRHLLQVPQIKSHKTLGDRSFSIAAPNLWNAKNLLF